MMAEIIAKLDKYFFRLIVPAIGDTLAMLAATMVLATVLGFVISVVLIITRKGGLRPNRWVYGVLNFLVNFIRSFPIMILIVALLPLTRVVMGTTMGVQGAVFPLTVPPPTEIAESRSPYMPPP